MRTLEKALAEDNPFRSPNLTPLRKEWRRREFSKKGKNDRIEACTEKARARNRKGCGQR